MAENDNHESMLDMYIFETTQMIDQLEQIVIQSEETHGFSDSIAEIFRIMHTIKGSSAMMLYTNLAELAHALEDLFDYLRKNEPENADYHSISDIILDAVDFTKGELAKISAGEKADADPAGRIKTIHTFLDDLKKSGGDNHTTSAPHSKESQPAILNYLGKRTSQEDGAAKQRYEAIVFFDEGCEMENIRAFGVVHKLAEVAEINGCQPENIMETEDDAKIVAQIRQNGFKVCFASSLDSETIHALLEKTAFLKRLEFRVGTEAGELPTSPKHDEGVAETGSMESAKEREMAGKEKGSPKSAPNQGLISVNIAKTDRLMDLMGEMLIAAAQVIQNPDLKGLKLANFQKAARQLHKITNEMQDAVMAIRMVSLETTFLKMHRIVRDMSKKMDKEVSLKVSGEETEVDKNIIEHISDPLMHLVRNSLDHGIEVSEERVAKGKPPAGTITLEARNEGSDVLIIVKDDGKGLNKAKILQKAAENGLLSKPAQEMMDKEIFQLIFLPGFSTKDKITEFSGRGVGMDVVTRNIEAIGGSVSVDSTPDMGTTFTLRIPLTLAIIDGMNLKVGASRYTIPTIAIKESFRPRVKDIISDPDGNEMIMVRGECYPILRLHDYYGITTNVTNLSDGILIMAEQNERSICIFADGIVGQQEVVVKTLPQYLTGKTRKIRGLAGCTLLGDGSISLILDTGALINWNRREMRTWPKH